MANVTTIPSQGQILVNIEDMSMLLPKGRKNPAAANISI
jgi:hypothetical protein